MRRLLLLMLCLSLLGADASKLELNGIVLTAGQTFKAVEGAEVRIEGSDRVARTDSAGIFKFSDVAPGIYRVVASKDGAEARGTINVNTFAPTAMALVMTPRGTTMFGLTPLASGTVYVGLSARDGAQEGQSTGTGLDNTLQFQAKIVHGWADFMRQNGELPLAEFSKQTPLTAAPNALMMVPPDSLPSTGYQELRGYSPLWLAFRPDGKKLYAACSDQLIRSYDPAQLKAQGSIPTPDSLITDLVVTSDSRYVVASLMSAGQPGLLVADTATHNQRNVYEVACGQPQALAAVPDGTLLVAGDAGIVARVDPATGKTMGTGAVGSKPTGVAFGGDRVYVVNSGTGDLSVLTYPDLKPAGRVRVGTAPRKAVVVGSRLFVSLYGAGRVAVLDTNGPTLLGTPEVGDGPVGLATDGARVYCACRDAGTVVGLEGRSGSVLFTTSPQPMSAPFGLVVHP